jgi:hypothetical protein
VADLFRLQAYAPDLNTAEGGWANLKNGLGNLAACTVDALADLTRTRLKKMQYRRPPRWLRRRDRPSPGHRHDATPKRKPQLRAKRPAGRVAHVGAGLAPQ